MTRGARDLDLLVLPIGPDDDGSYGVDAAVDQLDLIVTPGAWSRAIEERAGREVRVGDVRLIAASTPDLILLKLCAGGSRDGWDIDALLAVHPDRGRVIADVEARRPALPKRCFGMWRRLTEETGS